MLRILSLHICIMYSLAGYTVPPAFMLHNTMNAKTPIDITTFLGQDLCTAAKHFLSIKSHNTTLTVSTYG